MLEAPEEKVNAKSFIIAEGILTQKSSVESTINIFFHFRLTILIFGSRASKCDIRFKKLQAELWRIINGDQIISPILLYLYFHLIIDLFQEDNIFFGSNQGY